MCPCLLYTSERPLIISVAMELVAMAAPQPKVLNLTSVIDVYKRQADDHITDWTEVTDWVIEGEYLMAICRDGSIGWEGTRRRPEKRRITEGWRNIRRCLLWSIAGGRSNAMAVDAAGRLFSDQSGPEGEFFRQFTGVRRMAVFQPFLLVLHGEILSFVLFGKNGFERHDLPQVEQLLTAEEGKTVVEMCIRDSRWTCGTRRIFRRFGHPRGTGGNRPYHSGSHSLWRQGVPTGGWCPLCGAAIPCHPLHWYAYFLLGR